MTKKQINVKYSNHHYSTSHYKRNDKSTKYTYNYRDKYKEKHGDKHRDRYSEREKNRDNEKQYKVKQREKEKDKENSLKISLKNYQKENEKIIIIKKEGEPKEIITLKPNKLDDEKTEKNEKILNESSISTSKEDQKEIKIDAKNGEKTQKPIVQECLIQNKPNKTEEAEKKDKKLPKEPKEMENQKKKPSPPKSDPPKKTPSSNHKQPTPSKSPTLPKLQEKLDPLVDLDYSPRSHHSSKSHHGHNDATEHYSIKKISLPPFKKISVQSHKTEQSLKNFILAYTYKMIPNEQKLSLIKTTIDKFQNVMEERFPSWTWAVFGSLLQGTMTIFSDIDFVVFKDKEEDENLGDYDQLELIYKWFRRVHFGTVMKVIPSKTPIIKMICESTKLSLDISVNRHNGIQAGFIIKKFIESFPFLKYIFIFLKCLLQGHNLHNAKNGGMSSFLLFTLIFFYFLYYIKKANIKLNNNCNSTIFDKNYILDYINKIFNVYGDKKYGKGKSENNDNVNVKPIPQMPPSPDLKKDSTEQLCHTSSNSNEQAETDLEEDYSINIEIENNDYFKLEPLNNNKMDIDNGDTNPETNNRINISEFLIEFLQFYGEEFDYTKNGISLLEGGYLYSKKDRQLYYYYNDYNYYYYFKNHSHFLSVENFQDSSQDIGLTCKKFKEIRNLFYYAYKKLNHNNHAIEGKGVYDEEIFEYFRLLLKLPDDKDDDVSDIDSMDEDY